MKFLKASDTFESNKFFYLVCKICLFCFIAIEKRNGNYISRTKLRDVIAFAVLMIYGIYWTYDLLIQAPIFCKDRSIILELSISLNAKLQLVDVLVDYVIVFYNRHFVFEVFIRLYKVDKAVRFAAKTLKGWTLPNFTTVYHCKKW